MEKKLRENRVHWEQLELAYDWKSYYSKEQLIKFQKQIHMGNVVVRFRGGDRDSHMTDRKTEG